MTPIPPLPVEITQYGPSIAAGGWDGEGDSGTDAGLGCHDNLLEEGVSCALSKPAELALGVKPGEYLDIVLSDGTLITRRFDDRTDQTLLNARIDLYMKRAYDAALPDHGQVVAVKCVPI